MGRMLKIAGTLFLFWVLFLLLFNGCSPLSSSISKWQKKDQENDSTPKDLPAIRATQEVKSADRLEEKKWKVIKTDLGYEFESDFEFKEHSILIPLDEIPDVRKSFETNGYYEFDGGTLFKATKKTIWVILADDEEEDCYELFDFDLSSNDDEKNNYRLIMNIKQKKLPRSDLVKKIKQIVIEQE